MVEAACITKINTYIAIANSSDITIMHAFTCYIVIQFLIRNIIDLCDFKRLEITEISWKLN